MYTGIGFSGVPEYVSCMEEGDALSDTCSELRVCVASGSAEAAVISEHIDDGVIVSVDYGSDGILGFLSGLCNVVPGSPPPTTAIFNAFGGYEGKIAVGTRRFSKDPLSLLSRGDDATFADLCTWVIRALFAAEAMNITQEQASDFPSTLVFGEENQDMFKHVIATLGNFAEFYERTIGPWFPRSDYSMNFINDGTTGLLYAFPLGNLDEDVVNKNELELIAPITNGTLESIASNDLLRCGIVASNRPGFAVLNESSQTWQGFDVDFCAAIAAATDVESMEIVNLPTFEAGFVALADKYIDVYAGAPYSMENDVLEPTTGIGFSFSPCYFFGEKSLALATREEDFQFSDFVRWVVWGYVQAILWIFFVCLCRLLHYDKCVPKQSLAISL